MSFFSLLFSCTFVVVLIKSVISFCLIGLILAVMVTPSFKILNFYYNQSEIIAKHCVNKDKPALHCEGHCYLKKQLKSDKNQEENSQIPEVEIFMPLAACLVSAEISELNFIFNKASFFNPVGDISAYSGVIFIPPKSSFI